MMPNELDNLFNKPKYVNTTPIYPVRLPDILDLYEASVCLLIPKNSMTDVTIIKMSYLAFLIEISFTEGNNHLFGKLIKLMQLVTQREKIEIMTDEKKKYIISIDDEFEIHEKEFEKLREIIASQNLIEVKDDSLGTDFDKAKAEAKKALSDMNGKMADMEQQIVAYKCVMSSNYDDIAKLTIYQFKKEMERIDLIKSADVLQSAQFTGNVTFKNGEKAPHWLDQIKDKNIDDDLVLSKSQLDHLNEKNGLVRK